MDLIKTLNLKQNADRTIALAMEVKILRHGTTLHLLTIKEIEMTHLPRDVNCNYLYLAPDILMQLQTSSVISNTTLRHVQLSFFLKINIILSYLTR